MRHAMVALAFAAMTAAASAQAPIAIEWSEGPNMLQATAGSMTGIIGRDLIVAGGTFWHTPEAKRYVPWTQIYDTVGDRWRMGPDMPAERAYAFSVTIGDRLYVMGGAGQDGEAVTDGWILRRTQSEDGPTYEWVDGPGLPVAASWMMGGAIGRTIYVTGGAKADLSEAFNAVYALDLGREDARWRQLATMPGPPTSLLAATTCGGDLYVFGGYRIDREPGENVDDAWRYDVSEDEWVRIRPMPFAGRAMTALALDERRILIFGPYVQTAEEAEIHGVGHGHSGAVLLYDTETDRYEPLQPMPRTVVEIFFALREGRLYGAGGEWLFKVRSPFLFIGDIRPVGADD